MDQAQCSPAKNNPLHSESYFGLEAAIKIILGIGWGSSWQIFFSLLPLSVPLCKFLGFRKGDSLRSTEYFNYPKLYHEAALILC